jgi:hypothetical protein
MTPVTGRSCGSAGTATGYSPSYRRASTGRPAGTRASARSYDPPPRPSRIPRASTARAGTTMASAPATASSPSNGPSGCHRRPDLWAFQVVSPYSVQSRSRSLRSTGTSTRTPRDRRCSTRFLVSGSVPKDRYAATEPAAVTSGRRSTVRVIAAQATSCSSGVIVRRAASARARRSALVGIVGGATRAASQPQPRLDRARRAQVRTSGRGRCRG